MFYRGFFCISLVVLVSACGGGASTGTPDVSLSNTSSSSSSSSLPAQNPSTATGKILLQWQRPERRENGDYLEANEIGGYELRYKKRDSKEYSYLIVEDGWHESYEFQQQLVGAYQFQIAAFDTNGLYSEFVNLPVN